MVDSEAWQSYSEECLAKTIREPFRLHPNDRLAFVWAIMGSVPILVNSCYSTPAPLNFRTTSARPLRAILNRHPGMGPIGLLWYTSVHLSTSRLWYPPLISASPRLLFNPRQCEARRGNARRLLAQGRWTCRAKSRHVPDSEHETRNHGFARRSHEISARIATETRAALYPIATAMSFKDDLRCLHTEAARQTIADTATMDTPA